LWIFGSDFKQIFGESTPDKERVTPIFLSLGCSPDHEEKSEVESGDMMG